MALLSQLVGNHILTGVHTEDKYETPEHYTSCRFTVDGVTWEVLEDPEDGYRSSVGAVEIIECRPLEQYSIPVRCELTETNAEYILRFFAGDHCILELGTDGQDDYYPSFVCNYKPLPE